MLRLARLAATGSCWLFWLWLQHWPLGATVVTALSIAGVLAAIARIGARIETVALVIALAVTVMNLSVLHGYAKTPELLHARLAAVPLGHGLLSASVLWAMGDSLFSVEPLLAAWLTKNARHVVYGGLLIVIVLVAADSYFMGEGRPFHWPTYAPPSPARAFPAEEAYVHAAERFMRDTRGERFLQRKPDGTIRIVLNGA